MGVTVPGPQKNPAGQMPPYGTAPAKPGVAVGLPPRLKKPALMGPEGATRPVSPQYDPAVQVVHAVTFWVRGWAMKVPRGLQWREGSEEVWAFAKSRIYSSFWLTMVPDSPFPSDNSGCKSED